MCYFNKTRIYILLLLLLVGGFVFDTSAMTGNNRDFLTSERVVSSLNVYPNPVVDYLNVSITVSKESDVMIKIYDVLGNELVSLGAQRLVPGDQTISFNVANKLQSGVYFLKVFVGSDSIVKRLIVS